MNKAKTLENKQMYRIWRIPDRPEIGRFLEESVILGVPAFELKSTGAKTLEYARLSSVIRWEPVLPL